MKKILTSMIISVLLLSSLTSFAATPQPEAAEVPSLTEEAAQTPEPSPEASKTPESSSKPLPTPEASAKPTAEPVPTAEPESVPQQELSAQFNLTLDVIPRKYIISTNAVIELYNENDELLGSQLSYVGWGVPSFTMTFDVPEYRMGEKFKIKLVSGLRMMRYYDTIIEPGGTLTVDTYGYLNENGEYVQSNGCSVEGEPEYEKELCMYVNGSLLEDCDPYARIVDGVAMMPVRRIGEAMGLKVKYDPAYDSAVCSVGSDQVIFNANSAYTTIFGSDTYIPHETVYIDGSLFVPVRTLAEAFDSSLETIDFGDHLDVVIGESGKVREYRNRTPVNRNGIGSRTNYLVWVSKHEYKVRVYEGSQYNWELLKEFPCALGAWDTPTITGQFEYIERTQWDYGTYYVGPVLRFHNGYALHSTLLYYGGGEYDGRVGVNISHGCVRLHPQDINWIAATIPFRTRIYITE